MRAYPTAQLHAEAQRFLEGRRCKAGHQEGGGAPRSWSLLCTCLLACAGLGLQLQRRSTTAVTIPPPIQQPLQQPPPPPACQRIRRVAILGERHSGTNLAEALLRSNLDAGSVAVGGGLTAHKHWMQLEPRGREQACGVLLVLPVRNPWDWAQALHATCYCCEPMQFLQFNDFLRAPYTPTFARDPHGEACDSDVDLTTNRTFDNVLSMRAAKLRGGMGLALCWGLPYEVVRLEDLLKPEQQVAWVEQLATKYQLPLASRCQQALGEAPLPGCPGVAAAAQLLAARGAGEAAGEAAGWRSGQSALRSMREAANATGPALRLAAGRAHLHGRQQQQAAEPARAVQPVTADARAWRGEAFVPGDRESRSVYLNPGLLRTLPAVRSLVDSVNAVLDPALEAELGYRLLNPHQA